MVGRYSFEVQIVVCLKYAALHSLPWHNVIEKQILWDLPDVHRLYPEAVRLSSESPSFSRYDLDFAADKLKRRGR